MAIGHFTAKHKPHHRAVEKRAQCNVLYLAPTFSDKVNALEPVEVKWDPSCLPDQKEIDLILIAPALADNTRLFGWTSITTAKGAYNATLLPRWWGSSSSVLLQFSIVPHGNNTFQSSFPAAPIFTATYEEPASGIPPSADTSIKGPTSTVVNAVAEPASTTRGKTAAAVLLPLLFIAGLIAWYIKYKRGKGIEKRKRWTEAVDKRMSTISTDWKSVSGAGANAAIRNSMAVGNRNSSFSFGAIRPSSTYAIEGSDTNSEKRSMSQMRTGVGLRNPAGMVSTERVSRVSFAPDTRASRSSMADSRPSGESRRTRAFHSAYIPPVPALPDNVEKDLTDDSIAQFSPRQTQGPMALTPEDIHTIPTAHKNYNNSTTDLADFMPALSMMRTGGAQTNDSDDYLLPTPSQPAPAHPKPTTTAPASMTSPVMSAMPMQPMPANVMSPDEMLRAYAERKKSMAASKNTPISSKSISYPMPVADPASPNPSSNNMRVLYNAATGSVNSSTPTGSEDAESRYSADAYRQSVGAQYAFGHHANGSIGVGAYGGAQYAIGDDDEDSAKHAYGHAA